MRAGKGRLKIAVAPAPQAAIRLAIANLPIARVD